MDPTHSHYNKVFRELYDELVHMADRVPNAKKLELAMSFDSTKSSKEQIERTAPWGFLTLALDVATKFNIEREKEGGEGFKIVFKNTEPAGAPKIVQ